MHFVAVGMRFRDNYRFAADDKIYLEYEDSNPHDLNAIKILVCGEHVAYVARNDCIKICNAVEFTLELRLVDHYGASADLKLHKISNGKFELGNTISSCPSCEATKILPAIYRTGLLRKC